MAFYDIDGAPVPIEGSGGTNAVTPVPLSTVNAMLKCAYTYIEACRNGELIYGNGTGVHQRAGTICCATFARQLLQGIPYSDYLPANASTTSFSGKRWRYGYRMLGEDYYANDATTTADIMYFQHEDVGRAFPTDYKMEKAIPGDMIIFGEDLTTAGIRHIGMFVYKDANGTNYIMDSNITRRNGNLGIRIHKAYDHSTEPSNNPVGILRPDLDEVYFEPTFEQAQITDSGWSFSGENGYCYFIDIYFDVTKNVQVTLDADNVYTPNYSGRDHRILPLPVMTDGTMSGTWSGISNVVGKVSKFII